MISSYDHLNESDCVYIETVAAQVCDLNYGAIRMICAIIRERLRRSSANPMWRAMELAVDKILKDDSL